MVEEFTGSIIEDSLKWALFHTKNLDPDLDEINEKLFIDCGGIRVKVPAILQQELAVAWEAEILLRYETSKMCER